MPLTTSSRKRLLPGYFADLKAFALSQSQSWNKHADQGISLEVGAPDLHIFSRSVTKVTGSA